MFNQVLSYKKLNGLALSVFISRAAPLFNKIDTSLELILFAVYRILKHIMRMKVILSFSNSPLFTYLYTWNVRYLIMVSTLLAGRDAFSDQSIE